MNSNLNSVYPLSYSTFLNDIQRFKKSGGPNSDSFNFFDSPSHKYYKIFFYFGTKSENNAHNMSSEYSGLLAPTWLYRNRQFEELSSLGYYAHKYFVNEPFPASEPWNIDTYNARINDINLNNDYESVTDALNQMYTDYEYYDLVASSYGINTNYVDEYYTGTRQIYTGKKIHSEITFKNGMLTSFKILDDYHENSKNMYNKLNEYTKQRNVLKQRADYLKKTLDYAKYNKENYLKKYNEYVNDFRSNYFNSTHFKANPAYLFNTAWSYLVLQGFTDKAIHLQQFIELLSNISIESPWYFSSISGISDALNRKCASADGTKMDLGMRSKITIKCLPDAFDNRIGTLLDLYRSVVFDWNNKREIIPANLRKFDMAIYVFEAPDHKWHKEKRDDMEKMGDKWVEAYNDSIGNTLKSIFPNAINDNEQSNYNKGSASLIGIGEDGNFNFLASHKLIEFHDCEINYNTGTSAWAALDNKLGFTPEYNIEISFGDCYEISYNDLFQQYYGDCLIFTDESNTKFYNDQRELLNKRIEKKTDGWTKRLGIGLLNRLNDKGLSLAKKLSFGNLYGFSLTDTLNQISNGIQNPMMAFDTVMGYAKNGKEMVEQSKKQAKGIGNTMVNAAKNTIGFNEFASEYGSEDFTVGYSMSNPATMQIPSDTQTKRQTTNSSNNYVQHIQQQLGSDNNIADNNLLPVAKTQFSGGSLFEVYTKSKGIKSIGINGNIFKPSTIANNL